MHLTYNSCLTTEDKCGKLISAGRSNLETYLFFMKALPVWTIGKRLLNGIGLKNYILRNLTH